LILEVATADSYRQGAAAVYEQWLATPSPGDIVPVLERMTIEHRQGSHMALQEARSLATAIGRHKAEIDGLLANLNRR